MLIRITNNCTMGCTHCLVEASPDGEHMMLETFKQVVEFVNKLQDPIFMISGGEPTNHPFLPAILKMIPLEDTTILLLSNGEFIYEWDADQKAEIAPYLSGIQITNDSRFYPRLVENPNLPGVSYEDHIRSVAPCPNTEKNGIETTKKYPACFNLRSLMRHTRNMPEAMYTLYANYKFCCPSINIDGSIVAGEDPRCHKLGTVWDDVDVINRALLAMTCDTCGLIENCTHEQKKAIGEASIILPGEGLAKTKGGIILASR